MKAIETRKTKGLAMDYLRDLGFDDVYASDSANPIIIVTDSEVNLKRIPFRKIDFLQNKAIISFGKVNTELLYQYIAEKYYPQIC